MLDGAVIIQILKSATAKTFKEYVQQVFVPYILSKLQQAMRLDLVWDCYNPDSLEDTARAKHRTGVRRQMVGDARIPGNWASILRVDENTTELFSFLSGILHVSFQLADKERVITEGVDFLSKPPLQGIAVLAPCNYEEADTCIMLLAAHGAHNDHKKILINTVDTDVVVLAVALSRTLDVEAKVWVSFGTGKAIRFLAAHEIV